jgi:lipoprotein-releasing system permease protein
MRRRWNMVKSLEYQRNIMGLVMLAIQTIAVFVVYAVFSTMVAEKRHDIGVLLGIGARRRQIAGAFLLAAIVACLLGGLLGWALGWGTLVAANIASKKYGILLFPQDVFYSPDTPISWDPRIPLVFIGAMSLIGLIAAALPAWRAARIEPVDILREGG